MIEYTALSKPPKHYKNELKQFSLTSESFSDDKTIMQSVPIKTTSSMETITGMVYTLIAFKHEHIQTLNNMFPAYFVISVELPNEIPYNVNTYIFYEEDVNYNKISSFLLKLLK